MSKIVVDLIIHLFSSKEMCDHVCGGLEAPEARRDDLMVSALNLVPSLFFLRAAKMSEILTDN